MRVILFSLLSALSLQMWAQNTHIHKCGTAILEDEMRANDYNLDEQMRSFDESSALAAQSYQASGQENVLVIPVVFHIMYADETDNITMDQIDDALKVLNEDFRRQNADATQTRQIFLGVADDMEIEFKLAKLDPQGNCTNGVTRTQTNLSTAANDNVKPLSNWNHKKYLNIWVVRDISLPGAPNGTVLGYAYRPNPGQSYVRDGVVIRHDMMGRIGTAAGIGRTLTHEVGHYLGLLHPFDNGCFGGDNCTDTPPVASSSFGCNQNANTCSNDSPDLPDQIENFMDYADDVCTNMFTTQQKAIMRNSLANINLRGYLISNSNPDNTGITDGLNLPCQPEADFTTEEFLVCQGSTIQFQDRTTKGNPVSYQWFFPGGQPSSSTAQNPSVQYNNPGAFDVTLQVTNSHGTTIKTATNRVSVRANPANWYNTFADDFEQWNIPNNSWHVSADVDTILFHSTVSTGFNSSKSVKLNNFNIHNKRIVNLITNTVDLTNTKSVNLKFDFAYVKRNSVNSSDQIRIYRSTDCGQTWTFMRVIGGTQLWTASHRDTPFTPSNTSEWKTVSLPISGVAFEPSVMIKFEFNASGGGNNLYIDNVSFETVLSVEEEELGYSELNIFPNPASDNLNIKMNVGKSDNYQVNIFDLSGRLVQPILNNTKLQEGEQTLNIPLNGIKPGIYLLEIQNSHGSKFEKLIIE